MRNTEILSPDMAGIGEDHDLEKKMVNSDVISQADIKNYADYIIDQLKLLKNKSEQKKKSFVIDALNNNKILDQVKEKIFSGDLDVDEAQNAIKNVRLALVEKLKGRIDEKVYLVVRDISKENIPRENIISQLVDMGSGQEKIYKDQEVYSEDHEREMREAFALFKKLSPHPNVVSIKEYDPSNQRTIYEKLNMRDLDAYLHSGDPNKENFLVGLEVLRDCVVGAMYLAENKLVLQDIKLANLGLVVEENNPKGVLFDLEGLVKDGTVKSNRLFSGKYRPPLMDLVNREGIKAGEMVYQFGVCLQEIVELFGEGKMFKLLDQDIVKKLEALSKKMRNGEPSSRVSLPEAKMELEDIISALKQE